jgi:hypothetical protein
MPTCPFGARGRPLLPILGLLVLAAWADGAEEGPTRAEAITALRAGAAFMRDHIADHGGYAWASSVDARLKEGEGVAPPGTVWVQPPGTPAVGEAFLAAWKSTGDPIHLQAAQDAAMALVNGQLRSGGWHYRIEFDPARRRDFIYRSSGGPIADTPAPGGWDVWKQHRYRGNMTMVDDDTTAAALRFLMRMDRALQFEDAAVHGAVEYALASTLNAQYPIGAWSHNYDRFPAEPPDADHYPVLRASHPPDWSRTWTRDWTGCYMLNDRITQDMIATMLVAWRIYGDERCLAAAKGGGDFLLLAQMPDPQPGWCQQYNRQMQPVWDRRFEPPAITGMESQSVLETLLLLYRETADRRYLAPVPGALAYFRDSLLPDGSLARFYELRTNRPIYFTRDYELTYDGSDVPTHYRFTCGSHLGRIEAEYRRLLAAPPGELGKKEGAVLDDGLREAARRVIDAQNADGSWTEPGTVRDADGRKMTPPEGVVSSRTFIDNTATLCRFVDATGDGGYVMP